VIGTKSVEPEVAEDRLAINRIRTNRHGRPVVQDPEGEASMDKVVHSPTLYIGVSSVDEAIRKVQAAGGKVVTPKTPIPGMGPYGRVADTEGNVIGLFEAQA
jgi:predicted enzyme related to lactoylglutathione lyase